VRADARRVALVLASPIAIVATAAVLALFSVECAFAAPSEKPARVRTLDEITIEGEIPLPQVLFVTATESARIESAFARLYTPSALDIGSAAALPGFLCVPLSQEVPVITEVPAP
jgi:hypothetical protein